MRTAGTPPRAPTAQVESIEKLKMLREAGMNIMRLNFSHGSYEEHGQRIANLRECVAKHPLCAPCHARTPNVAERRAAHRPLHASSSSRRRDGRLCGLALDTKGPEIRTGINKEEDLVLKAGDSITVGRAAPAPLAAAAAPLSRAAARR